MKFSKTRLNDTDCTRFNDTVCVVRYGMINHVVYDVFVNGDDEDEDGDGLCGSSRFRDDLERFTQKGLTFR